MRLIDATRQLLDQARAATTDAESMTVLDDLAADLDGPLRIAVAGRVKAGKSTLVNALVGDQIAPTDAGECTKIVTWYRDGVTYRVEAIIDGERTPLPFSRATGSLDIDLGERGAEQIDRLEIDWPTAALRSQTIIDTPGLGSINTATSDRTVGFLTPEDDQPTDADAVVYLMRHVHHADIEFLESFHDETVAHAAPVNAVAVLSRADEIGSARLDAMDSARRIAARYRTDPKIRRLCATVLPVAGLLAEAGASLREAEFRAFERLASLPDEVVEPLQWSADRFIRPESTDVLTGEERSVLIERFGLFGARIAIDACRRGEVRTAAALSAHLVEQSGIAELRGRLESLFANRRDLLKARSALAALERHMAIDPSLAPLRNDLEQVRAQAHELTEARHLNLIRGGSITFKADRRDELERLLGADGVDPQRRLGIDEAADTDTIRAAAMTALERNQRLAESAMGSHEAREIARVAVRTCEGILAALG